MKAEVVQQRSLLELAELDAELSRIEHRAGHLAELQQLEDVQATHREANDRLAALQLALEDLDAQVAKFEAEIDAVRGSARTGTASCSTREPSTPSSSPNCSTNSRRWNAASPVWRTRCSR